LSPAIGYGCGATPKFIEFVSAARPNNLFVMFLYYFDVMI
jgi:hypothetical protein